jgi:hypothetical protein
MTDDEHVPDLDDAAAAFLRAAWRSSPGVVLSLVFHGVLLALLPLIIFQERIRELAGIPITIGVSAVRLDPERPYKPISSAPPTADGAGLEEPSAMFPDAAEAQRNESRVDRSESERVDGRERVALQFLANDPAAGGFRGRLGEGAPGTNDVLGVGGGSGNGGARSGMGFGGGGGRAFLVVRGGGSAATEDAVRRGLSWLARHQETDGAWRAQLKKPMDVMDAPEVATTSLALVAFLTAGYGPKSQVEIKDPVTGRMLRYGDTVRAALRYLDGRMEQGLPLQSPRVKLPADETAFAIYEHAFATMAYCEAYRASHDRRLEEQARRLLAHLLARQNARSGWQYRSRDGRSDLSVTGACVQALRSARLAGLEVPTSSVEGVRAFLSDVSDGKGHFGYMDASALGYSTTAIGIYVARFLEPRSTRTTSDAFGKVLPQAAENVAKNVGDAQTMLNRYDWYYSMLGLFEYEGPKGPSWKAVNAAVTTSLVKSQARGQEDTAGSWDPDGDAFLQYYGRPIVTAFSVLTLEVYYRYAGVAEEGR